MSHEESEKRRAFGGSSLPQKHSSLKLVKIFQNYKAKHQHYGDNSTQTAFKSKKKNSTEYLRKLNTSVRKSSLQTFINTIRL